MIGLFLAGFITSGPMLLLPLFFQDVRGDSVVIAAVALIPQSVGMLIARGSIGKLIDRFGACWLIGGVFVTIVGTLPFVYFNTMTSYYWLAIVMIIRGIGGAAVVQALMADPFVGLARDQIAAASIGTWMIQQIGNGFGAAVLATVVTAYTSMHQIS